MSTPNTPIQFSEDDRQLLIQLVGIVQNLDARLSVVEETRNQTSPSLLTAFRHVLQAELQPIKEQLTRMEREFKNYKRQTQLEIANLTLDLTAVQEQVNLGK